MRGEGITSIAVWGYRGCEAMSALACDDPEAVWAATRAAFLRPGERGRGTGVMTGGETGEEAVGSPGSADEPRTPGT